MKVYFIGAGPGAKDLITVRGARYLAASDVVLYAGSLVPEEILEHCHPKAVLVNTAGLDLDQQMEHYSDAKARDVDVARVHSGDPAIYGAISEQINRLNQADISWEIVPGVSSFTAAAAELGSELTKPNVSQTIILTRVSGRATAVPALESVALLAAHKSTLCIFLSGPHLNKIVQELLLHYPPFTPVALVYRSTWPDRREHRSTLEKLLTEIHINDWTLTTMLIVGAVLAIDLDVASSLYSKNYTHKFRKARQRKDNLIDLSEAVSQENIQETDQ
ncbi:MAG: precorrin-4 C(11)-methyltransferase [Candidatus Melainabacteria bacterium]|nr:precorrin-4 C(11)-methyltransferase [Candidatus Melainabacteria bacterium]